MHRIGIHDPSHDLGVGANIWRGDIALRADKTADLGRITARHLFQLLQAQRFGVDNDATFGATVGQIHQRAFPGHPHRQGATLV